jgi:type II secretory pathway component PulF
MPNFAYKALDSAGKSSAGSLAAANRPAALQSLSQQGLIPVEVQEQSSSAPAATAPQARPGGRISAAVAETFLRELANLLAGGVSLSRALRILSREASTPAAKLQWTAIHDEVVGGRPLAEAMSQWPTFTKVQVAMVRAGETGGFLEVVLGQIADFRARERDLKSRVKGALIYPAVLATMSVAVVIFLLLYFIPRFAPIFSQFGAALPALTRGIIAASHGLLQYGLFVLVAAAVIAMLAHRGLNSEGGRRMMEKFVLKVPAVGIVLSRFALVRFCRMLGTLLGSGVPLVTALKVARESLGNQTLSDAVAHSIDEVQRGTSLARSLANCPQLFSASIIEIIAVAEESGRLEQELLRLANANESELDRRLRTLVTLLEPLLLFIMAAIVGTVVIGMLLPVFTLQDYIK